MQPSSPPLSKNKGYHAKVPALGRSAPPLFIAVVEEELYSNCSRTLILSQVVKTGHTLMSGGKTQTENEQASPLKITYEQKKKRRRSNFTDCF